MGAAGGRRVERDPSRVLALIAGESGHDIEVVGVVAAAVRTVIDDLLADGCVVITGDLFVSFGDSPTRRALRDKAASPDPVPEAVLRLDHEAVARWLGLEFEVYAERPLANKSLVGKEVFDLLGAKAPARPVVWEVLEAWDATFTGGRGYRVSSAGREAAFENWLVKNLDLLADHGLPVVLAHRQYHLPNGKVPDLICRATADTSLVRAGDWIVVELKSTRFYNAAADQVEGYVTQVTKHLASDGEMVAGLLITDGADYSEVQALTARGIAHLSLAALGYRMVLQQEESSTITSLSTSLSLLSPLSHEDSVGPDPSSSPNTPLISSGQDAFDGPKAYRAHLFSTTARGDATADPHHAVVCRRLWAKREERRTQYVHYWGETEAWPAQHPTTVIKLGSPHPLQAAVCIRCDWVVSALGHPDGPIDLHADAKAHALAHTHDPVLERGENPPRTRRRSKIQAAIDDARVNRRRAGRRVARRDTA